jgi:arylsulfatase A-like enzyme
MLLGAALGEAVCVTARSPSVTPRFAFLLGAFAQIQAFALVLGLLLGALWLASSALLARLREQGWLRAPDADRRLDLAVATLAVAPITLLVLDWLLFELANGVRNRELAALASGLLAFLGACLSLVPWGFLLLASGALRKRFPALPSALLLLPGALLSVSVLGWLAKSAGLEQLDPWLLAAPSAALALLPGGQRLARHFEGKTRVNAALGGLVAASLLALLAGLGTPATPARLWRGGAWSRPAIAILRRLTDFDRDGYSGWFGGGDCAPFDAKVHPNAREIPLDGLDNNCLGGDGGHRAPLPHARAGESATPRAGPRLNLVLVTIETLRADHVSFSGYARPTTPRLDELAKSSVVFERSYATTPTTRLSVAALLSGRLPSSLAWQSQSRERQMRHLAPNNPWLPALLAERGYSTLAVHTSFRAFTQVENAGFSRGFARYDTSTELTYSGGTMHGFPGGAQVDRALTLLDENAGRPLFLWLHLLEPHYSYEQSPYVPRFGDDELALYDADIAEADRQVGRLLDGLRARNLFDTSLIVVTGDHGEEFGEHGQRWHGSNLYEPQLRTATLMRVPGLGAQRVAEAVSFLDFAPTVLDLLGVDGELEGSMGRDLVPLLHHEQALQPGFLVENFKVDDGSQALLGVVEFPFKLLRTGEDSNFELYDLRQDPRETKDLWLPDEPTSRRLANRLYEYLESDLARGEALRKGP